MSDHKNLIRIASGLPVGDPTRKAILAALGGPHVASLNVTAASPDTEDFIEWVLATKSDDRIKESVAIRFLELKSKRQPKPYAPSTRKTGDLMVGEMVYVDASKNTNPMNTDTCDLYNGKVATITGVTSDGLTCSLHNGDKANYSVDLSGQKAFFTGFASGKSTGLFRYTAKSDFVDRFDGPKILFEAVYLRKESTKVDPGRIEEIEAYVDRGSMMGQTRSRNYYTGTLGTFAISEKDQMYFGLVAQQRESVQSTMNPTTGKLLYLGVIGQRPQGWKADAVTLGLRAE